MYPMLNEGVEIGTFTYEGSEDEHYYARNPDGVEFEIGARIAYELARADGTRKLKLRQRVVNELKDSGLIRTSRLVKDDNYNRFTLIPIGERAMKYRDICILINRILPIVSILTFMAGIFLKFESTSYWGDDFDLFFYYGMLAMSLLAHECGHLVAGLAYGYNISELGVLLFGVFPAGAYVAANHEEENKLNRCDRIQFSLAGIELNLMITGICLLTSIEIYALSGTLFSVAYLNVALAVLNILPAQGLDGERALSDALGVESINALARKWLHKPKFRKKLFKSGYKGYAYMCLFGFSILCDATVWLVIGSNVLYAIISIFA